VAGLSGWRKALARNLFPPPLGDGSAEGLYCDIAIQIIARTAFLKSAQMLIAQNPSNHTPRARYLVTAIPIISIARSGATVDCPLE
jgi:hypothetical protein